MNGCVRRRIGALFVKRRPVALGRIVAGGEVVARVSRNLVVFLGGGNVVVLSLQVFAEPEARLVSILAVRIVLQILLRTRDPGIFELRVSHPAALPLDARDFELHILGPLRVGISRLMRDIVGDLFDHVEPPLRIVQIGGVFVRFRILAGTRGRPIILRGFERVMLIVEHVGEQPDLQRVAR